MDVLSFIFGFIIASLAFIFLLSFPPDIDDE